MPFASREDTANPIYEGASIGKSSVWLVVFHDLETVCLNIPASKYFAASMRAANSLMIRIAAGCGQHFSLKCFIKQSVIREPLLAVFIPLGALCRAVIEPRRGGCIRFVRASSFQFFKSSGDCFVRRRRQGWCGCNALRLLDLY